MEYGNINPALSKVQRKFAFKNVFLHIMQKIRQIFSLIQAVKRRVLSQYLRLICIFLITYNLFVIPQNNNTSVWNSLFLQSLSAQSSPNAIGSINTNSDTSKSNITLDTAANLFNWKMIPSLRFVDSLKNPLQKQRFLAPFNLQTPNQTVRISNDPFNPFVHETYLRKSRGKFWFFGVSIFIALYLLYFRSAFSKQFELRLKGFLKSYYFEDLLLEQSISSAAGSIHAYALGVLVFSQGIMLGLITSEYNRLNNFYIYLLLLITVVGFLLIFYFLQTVFTSSLGIYSVLYRQMQRQININLVFSFFTFPAFLYIYYNATETQNQTLSVWIWGVLIVWISVRLLLQVWGILRDNAVSLITILYLCTLEIIPYLLVFKFLSSSI